MGQPCWQLRRSKLTWIHLLDESFCWSHCTGPWWQRLVMLFSRYLRIMVFWSLSSFPAKLDVLNADASSEWLMLIARLTRSLLQFFVRDRTFQVDLLHSKQESAVEQVCHITFSSKTHNSGKQVAGDTFFSFRSIFMLQVMILLPSCSKVLPAFPAFQMYPFCTDFREDLLYSRSPGPAHQPKEGTRDVLPVPWGFAITNSTESTIYVHCVSVHCSRAH